MQIITEERNKMSILTEKNVVIAEAYYKAMEQKDIAGVASYLHPHVQFVSPTAVLAGKGSALEAAQRYMSIVRGIRIRTRFSFDNLSMLTYDADFGEPIGICRTAVQMTFTDGLIERLELYFDASPFRSIPRTQD